MKLNLSPAPHVHASQTTQALMLNVIIALIPCALAGIWVFGPGALILICLCVLGAVASEYLWQVLTSQPVHVNDLSAAVTGLILALNLPATTPWWVALMGSAFAVVVVKGLFGGLGDNFINPALAARAMMLAAWPRYMTVWRQPAGWNLAADAVTTATPLSSPGNYTLTQLALGSIPGSVGEVCKIAIVIGFIYLVVTKTITWRIPVVMVASATLFCTLLGMDPAASALSGGLLFGAVFMATDYVTCPMDPIAQIVYAALAGLLVALIRKYSSYPEGVTYAILLMNIAAPIFDHFCKRHVYGHEKGAKQNV